MCGFVQPPKEFQDPDLELAQKLDLRKDDADPNGMDVSDVQGVEDSINDADRDGIDDSTGMPMDQVGLSGGDPEMGEDPDLVCPVCGEGFNSQPTSVSMENPMAGGMGEDDPQAAEQNAEQGIEDDGNAAEGDPCPNCGKGLLEPPGEAQTEMGEDPEMAGEMGQPGEGDPTVDPDADPDDPEGSDEANPFDKGPGDELAEDDDDDVDEDGDGIPDSEEDENDDGIPDSEEEDDSEDEGDSPFGNRPDDDEDDDDKKSPAGHTPWKR